MGYFNRRGESISPTHWAALNDDEDYRVVRHYYNGDYLVTVNWLGGKIDTKTVPRDFWKLFELRVLSNVSLSDGTQRMVLDPLISDHYPTEESAIKAFEKFLVENTDSYYGHAVDAQPGKLVMLGDLPRDIVSDEHEDEMESDDCVSISTFESNPDAGTW